MNDEQIKMQIDNHHERIATLERRSEEDRRSLMEVRGAVSRIEIAMGKSATSADISKLHDVLREHMIDQAKDREESLRESLRTIPQDYANRQALILALIGTFSGIIVAACAVFAFFVK